jgi:hypothetical protein
MNSYVLIGEKNSVIDRFIALTDKDAEEVVEREHSESDGHMVLYRTEPVAEWP